MSPKRSTEKTTSSQFNASQGAGTKAITTIHDGYDIADLIANAGTGRRQSLQGFDDDYIDIVDYIVRCTHKIWEEKGIGLIYSHYIPNVIIHTSDGITYGRDKVVANTIKTISAFPDVRLYADDVIWSGNDEDGFHTSHRITWVGQNTGHSNYGPPTGRKIMRQGIVHCIVKANKIVEEWIARDELALIRQLGFNEHRLARKMAALDAITEAANPGQAEHGEVSRLVGQTPPEPVSPQPDDMDDVEYFVRKAIHEIWNWRLLNKINNYYVTNYKCRVSTNRNLYGLGDFKVYILGIMAAFPDLAITIDHICWLGNEQEGYRVATRWTMQATHTGPGVYGKPTGKRVKLLGISHHLVKNGLFVQEWTSYDEFALLKQIYAPNQDELSSGLE